MASDYDKGKVTDRERLAASRQKEIAKFNAESTRNQLNNQLSNYDMANTQNKALRDVQLKQNQRKSESERFEAARNLQNAAIGLLGSMNQAMNGSTLGNAMRMFSNRNDSDNNTYWTQLQTNQNAVNNAYQESYNQNQVAKNDAVTNARKALRDIEGDLSANLSNINPNLYITPGTGEGNMKSDELYNSKLVKANKAALSGYLMPANAEQNVRGKRNKLQGGDYFSRLVNGFNRK